ncbi:MAG: hypothetical protein KAH08_02130 [Methylococcales bacterium]|nr:hypothetical protein [Methylococcales bacterium]
MKGRMQAIMAACFLSLLSLILPPVSIVSSATMALVTLRKGAKEGAYILVCACLAVALLGTVIMGDYRFPLIYSLFLWAPVWGISVILREGRHLFLAIEIVIGIAIAAVVIAYSTQPELGSVWQAELGEFLKPLVSKANPEAPKGAIDKSLGIFFHFMLTGLIAQIYVISLLAGLFLGRGWQALLYNPGGFKQEYLTLRGQKILGGLALLSFILAWGLSGTFSEIFSNISVIFFILYAFLGIVILHSSFSVMRFKNILVPFLYISIIIIPHAMIPAALIGLTDTWLDLRKKILNQSNT